MRFCRSQSPGPAWNSGSSASHSVRCVPFTTAAFDFSFIASALRLIRSPMVDMPIWRTRAVGESATSRLGRVSAAQVHLAHLVVGEGEEDASVDLLVGEELNVLPEAPPLEPRAYFLHAPLGAAVRLRLARQHLRPSALMQ